MLLQELVTAETPLERELVRNGKVQTQILNEVRAAAKDYCAEFFVLNHATFSLMLESSLSAMVLLQISFQKCSVSLCFLFCLLVLCFFLWCND